MSVNLSNILNGGTLPAAGGGTGLTSSGNTGNVLTSTGSGWISSALPTANTTTLGGVKVDGTTIVANNGIISANVSSGASATKTISNKTGAYTIVSGDLGKIINCTSGTFTVSLTAAASLGSGFTCTIWNTGTGAITIDPNASETIDGVATLILRQGEGLAVVCNGTNWETDDKKPMRGYAENFAKTDTRPSVVADGSVAIGCNASCTAGGYSVALGVNATTSDSYNTAIGRNATASTTNATAIGSNSASNGSQAVTGAGAMALGGSYASGTDSFAAAIGNNTSSYGAIGANAVAIGYLCKASSGSYSVSIGRENVITCSFGIGIGYGNIANNADNGTAIGYTNTAAYGYAIGNNNYANGWYSFAMGYNAKTSQLGKYAFASGTIATQGDAQYGKMVLRGTTGDATPKVITSDAGTAGTTNQVVLPNSGVFTFSILVTAVRTVGEAAGWKFEGVILRTGSASGTSIVDYTKTVLGKTTSSWDCNISADTTNGALAVTVTGAASSTKWVAVVDTAEVIG
jgi:hypothetical protein